MIRANDNISLPGFYLIQTLMKHIYLILYIFVMIIYSCSSPSNGINIDDDTSNSTSNDTIKDENNTEETENEEYDILLDNTSKLSEIKFEPGLKIAIKNGTYNSQNIIFTANGEENAPITLMAEELGKVKFTGNSTITINGKYLIVKGFKWENPENIQSYVVKFEKNSESCKLENCSITGFDTKEDIENDSKWLSIYGTHNTVIHCSFSDKKNIGALCVVWLEEDIEARHIISHNYFSRPTTLYDNSNSAINGQETIRIGDSNHSLQDAYCLVDSNYFYHCHGELAEIISNKSCKNTYNGNGFYECKGTLTLRHGNECTVTGNYFIGNGMNQTGGVRIIGENHMIENNKFETLGGEGYKAGLCIVRGQENNPLNGYAPVKNAVIRNNIFIDCNLAFHINYKGSSTQTIPPTGTKIYNNIAIAKNKTGYVIKYEESDMVSDILWDNNLLYGKIMNNIFDISTSNTKPEIPQSNHDINKIKDLAGTSF